MGFVSSLGALMVMWSHSLFRYALLQQLFGDTVNTASRMESTGIPSKIQISQSTANLIRQHGKSHWIVKREGGVEAKGKGVMETYWVVPEMQMARTLSTVSDESPMQVDC